MCGCEKSEQSPSAAPGESRIIFPTKNHHGITSASPLPSEVTAQVCGLGCGCRLGTIFGLLSCPVTLCGPDVSGRGPGGGLASERELSQHGVGQWMPSAQASPVWRRMDKGGAWSGGKWKLFLRTLPLVHTPPPPRTPLPQG